MKKITIALCFLFCNLQAMADGFVCVNQERTLKIRVYNKVQPGEGTRNPSILILSDLKLALGNRTIATFHGGKNLESVGALYIAKVDHRYRGSNRKGELIAGTKVKYLKAMILDIDFRYDEPVKRGTKMVGQLKLLKRNDSVIHVDLSCIRYLKHKH